MDKSRICALHDTAVYCYRNVPIDNYITCEKWGNCWALQAKTRFKVYTAIFGSFVNLIKQLTINSHEHFPETRSY